MLNTERIFANQNHIRFESVPKSKKNPRVDYNREALLRAMQDLSHSALKLYLYIGLFQHEDGGIYLSKQDTLRCVGMSEKSYFSAKKELKEKGYIYHDPKSDDKNFIVFSEMTANLDNCGTEIED